MKNITKIIKKVLKEDLLQQIRLMNYDRSKTLQEQEFNNIRLLKEDCVQSMAMIDPKTGKGMYVDSVTGKPCTPKTPESTKIVKKDSTIKPLWNTNIKEFVHPAYVDYPDVAKYYIYKKNADGTFSLKYPEDEAGFVSMDSPEVIKKRTEIFYDENFKKYITDKTSGDNFRKWVNENPDILKKVNDELKKQGIKGTLDKTGPFDNNSIKVAWKVAGTQYVLKDAKKMTDSFWSTFYKGYLENLEDIDYNTNSQQIASYRKDSRSLKNFITQFLSSMDKEEIELAKKNQSFKDEINWVGEYADKFMNELISDFDNYWSISGGYQQYLSALQHRNKVATEMGWTKPAKIYLQTEDLQNMSSISRTTAIDPSYVIAVLWLDSIQQMIQQKIKFEIASQNDKAKPSDYETWSEDKKTQWMFTNVFRVTNDYTESIRGQLQTYEQIIYYVYNHNQQILAQTPTRGTISNEKNNLGACTKTIYRDKQKTDFGGVILGNNLITYKMSDVCKNYGGIWIGGISSSQTCCCADIPTDKTTYVDVRAILVNKKVQPGGGTTTQKYATTLTVDLTKSCERIKDTRDIEERAVDVVQNCKSDYHCWLDLASIAALIIPGVGITISMLIDFANAATYLYEAGVAKTDEDKNAALLGAGFSILGGLVGGGLGQGKALFGGVPPKVLKFGEEFTGVIYDVYKTGGAAGKTLSKIEQEEIEGAWEMLVKKHAMTEAEEKIAQNYLKQITNLQTQQLQLYFKSVQELSDKIGLANFRRIGGEQGFKKILGQENGNIITALEKYGKTEAGKEFLQELGLLTVLSDYLPTLQQNLMVQSAESGEREIIGGKTALSTMVQVSNYDLKSAQKEFGSDRSVEDNKKMREAWLSGWRPGMVILKLDETDYKTQLEKKQKDPTFNLNPKFIVVNNKFAPYVTKTLKRKLVDEFTTNLDTQRQEEEKRIQLMTPIYVDDEDYDKTVITSDKVVIPKNKEKVNPLNYNTVPATEDDLKIFN
jgi:hypothetical protein